MSTRANVVIQDQYDHLWFYRHSDGYPEITIPSLQVFLGWLKDGKIRNNVSQCAGWLIILGHKEYVDENLSPYEPQRENQKTGWKVGAYEPTTSCHGDVEYVYVVDLKKEEIRVYVPSHPGNPILVVTDPNQQIDKTN